MRRRAFIGATGAVLAAGCNGPRGSSSQFAGEPCPPVGGSARTCYHTAGDGDDLVLEPDAERHERPGPIRFTLHNRRSAAVDVVLPSSRFAREVDGRWQRIPKHRQDNAPHASASAGGSLRFGLVPGDHRDLSGIDRTYAYPFGAGRFAFGVRTLDPATVALARVDVGGDSLTVTEPANLSTERSGSTMTVTRDRGDGQPYTLTFSSAPEAADSLRLAPEVVADRPDLKAAAFLRRDGVDTVVVRDTFGYFRTPVEWLEAAGVWDGGDHAYEIEGATFTVAQERRRDTS